MKLVRPARPPQNTPQEAEGAAPSARRFRQGTTASMMKSKGSSMPAASRAGITSASIGTPIMPRLPSSPDLLRATMATVATATDQNQGSNTEGTRRQEGALSGCPAESVVKARGNGSQVLTVSPLVKRV